MVQHVDQFVCELPPHTSLCFCAVSYMLIAPMICPSVGGYGTVDYKYLGQGITAICEINLEDPNSCAAINSWQIINYVRSKAATKECC